MSAPRPSAPPPQAIAKYEEIRGDIRDGDIFLLRGAYLSSRLFERTTHGAYSHATIAMWWGDRLMLLQAEAAGVEAVPLSYAIGIYEGRCDWYSLRREAIPDFDLKFTAVAARAKAYLGIKYGYLNLFKKLFKRALGIHLHETKPDDGMFCSQFVAEAFKNGGMALVPRDAIDTFPADIAFSTIIEYRKTVAHDPSTVPERLRDYIPPGGPAPAG